jgi:hypothetical protein
LPGDVTLPAGKYVFKLANSFSDRYIVHVMDEKESKMLATLFTMKAQRTRLSDDPEIAFMETPANMPPAVKTWWHISESIGREFIYPRDQAIRLARTTREPVLTTTAPVSTETFESSETVMIGPDQADDGTMSQPQMETQTASAAPAGGPNEAVGTSGQTPTSEPAAPAPRRTLPQTASNLPLVGLLGLLSLAGALGLRAFARART